MRTILLVIDGLGVGAAHASHHTLRTVIAAAPARRFPALARLGILDHLHGCGQRVIPRCAAPDTYLGHLEMVDAQTQPRPRVLDDVRAALVEALHHRHTLTSSEHGLLVVDGRIAVYDNLDGAHGLSLCVLGSAGEVHWRFLLTVARRVRAAVDVPRVLAMQGIGWRLVDLLARHARIDLSAAGGVRRGLHSGSAGVHGPGYRVRHLPYRCAGPSLLTRLAAAEEPVVLVGKTADLFAGDQAHPAVTTSAVATALLAVLDQRHHHGLVFANVQAVDLACHAGDAEAAAVQLAEVDDLLSTIAGRLGAGDQLIVTADHGNDPAAGVGHTVEYVPVAGADLPGSGVGLGIVADLVAARHL